MNIQATSLWILKSLNGCFDFALTFFNQLCNHQCCAHINFNSLASPSVTYCTLTHKTQPSWLITFPPFDVITQHLTRSLPPTASLSRSRGPRKKNKKNHDERLSSSLLPSSAFFLFPFYLMSQYNFITKSKVNPSKRILWAGRLYF
jgi:hypothetical protein